VRGHARGLFIHDWESDGVIGPRIFIMIGDPSKTRDTETRRRIASIFLHEYHEYLDWQKGNPDAPEKIPDLPYKLAGEGLPGDADLTSHERWIWYKAMMDWKEFSSTPRNGRKLKH
jgi:hypothetical protein